MVAFATMTVGRERDEIARAEGAAQQEVDGVLIKSPPVMLTEVSIHESQW